MDDKSVAKIPFLKKELLLVLETMRKEKERFDAIDYSKLSDEDAADTGEEHEMINMICSMLYKHYADSFGNL